MFTYDDAVLARYPTVRAGLLHATGLANGPTAPGLRDTYRAEQAVVAERLAATAIADLPSIAAWRRVFTSFGAKPTQHRNAAEALLRRLGKHGDIPSINTLVDIGNLVSIRYALPVAVLDLAGVSGTTTVRFATGTERFTAIGDSDAAVPTAGEVVFVDDAGVASARRWCWRQSTQTATGPATIDALIVVEGHHDGADHDVAAATADLAALLADHQPGARVTTHALPPATIR